MQNVPTTRARTLRRVRTAVLIALVVPAALACGKADAIPATGEGASHGGTGSAHDHGADDGHVTSGDAAATGPATAHGEPPGRRIDIDTAKPPKRVEVAVGERVELVVTAGVADEVHLHGYDLSAAIAPGAPAVLRFTADLPGSFEMELENSATLVTEIDVR